jgi:integrase
VPNVRLTARNVPTLPAPETGRSEYWDTILPGFYLRITASGVRTFGAWCRVGGTRTGRRRRYTIGRYPTIELADARDKARILLHEAATGVDSGLERERQRAAGTFRDLSVRFLDGNRDRLRPRTHKEWTRILNREILPILGSRPPMAVTRADVRALLAGIVVKAPTMANRTLEVVRRVFNWALSEDLVSSTPCAGLLKPSPERRRDRVYSADEMRSIIAAIAGTELADLVPLILYTGVRSGEARGASWSEIDLQARLWIISESRSQNAEPHPVPLSEGAMRVLRRRRVMSAGPWVFPAETREGYMDEPNWTIKRCKRVEGFPQDFRLHDLRRTVATRIAALGTLDPIVEAVLGHTPPGLKRTYNRYQPIREMRVALDAWSTELDDLLAANREPPQPQGAETLRVRAESL